MTLLFCLLSIRAFAGDPGADPLSVGRLAPDAEAAFADAAGVEIGAAPGVVERLLADARQRRDTEAIACLTAKLVPLRTLGDVGRDATASLRAHLAARDDAQSELDTRKLAVVLARTRAIVADARACIATVDARRDVPLPAATDPPDVIEVSPEVPWWDGRHVPCESAPSASPC